MNTGMGSIPYYLYSDPGRTAVWGDDGVTIPAPSLSSMGNGLDVLYMVYGRATVPNPGPPPGDYTDVVTVSVLF
jgi:spore coat protein U-like protein